MPYVVLQRMIIWQPLKNALDFQWWAETKGVSPLPPAIQAPSSQPLYQTTHLIFPTQVVHPMTHSANTRPAITLLSSESVTLALETEVPLTSLTALIPPTNRSRTWVMFRLCVIPCQALETCAGAILHSQVETLQGLGRRRQICDSECFQLLLLERVRNMQEVLLLQQNYPTHPVSTACTPPFHIQ